jgi:dolichol-phosphate mannosyltransferase
MAPLVVLPTYNEASNLTEVLERVRAAVPEAVVLVVDDSSPDGTAALAHRAGATLGKIEVLSRPGKSGLGSAYRAGFTWGLERDFDVFVEMDADLSHEPEAIPSLLAPVNEGVELVIGSRYVSGGTIPDWSWHRRMLSRGGNLYAARMLGLDVRDSTAGFRAYAASLLRRLSLDAVRAGSYGFQIEMTYAAVLAGATVLEVPIRFVDRTMGSSKMSVSTIVEALGLVTLWGLERRRPSIGSERQADRLLRARLEPHSGGRARSRRDLSPLGRTDEASPS